MATTDFEDVDEHVTDHLTSAPVVTMVARAAPASKLQRAEGQHANPHLHTRSSSAPVNDSVNNKHAHCCDVAPPPKWEDCERPTQRQRSNASLHNNVPPRGGDVTCGCCSGWWRCSRRRAAHARRSMRRSRSRSCATRFGPITFRFLPAAVGSNLRQIVNLLEALAMRPAGAGGCARCFILFIRRWSDAGPAGATRLSTDLDLQSKSWAGGRLLVCALYPLRGRANARVCILRSVEVRA